MSNALLHGLNGFTYHTERILLVFQLISYKLLVQRQTLSDKMERGREREKERERGPSIEKFIGFYLSIIMANSINDI